MNEILKYIEDGITINGNPKDGYIVFTIQTQHFKISSLNELTIESFEKAIVNFKERQEMENNFFSNIITNL